MTTSTVDLRFAALLMREEARPRRRATNAMGTDDIPSRLSKSGGATRETRDTHASARACCGGLALSRTSLNSSRSQVVTSLAGASPTSESMRADRWPKHMSNVRIMRHELTLALIGVRSPLESGVGLPWMRTLINVSGQPATRPFHRATPCVPVILLRWLSASFLDVCLCFVARVMGSPTTGSFGPGTCCVLTARRPEGAWG